MEISQGAAGKLKKLKGDLRPGPNAPILQLLLSNDQHHGQANRCCDRRHGNGYFTKAMAKWQNGHGEREFVGAEECR
jgi:hypothetical protein